MYTRMHVCMYVCMDAYMNVCMYACMHVCMYVLCMHVKCVVLYACLRLDLYCLVHSACRALFLVWYVLAAGWRAVNVHRWHGERDGVHPAHSIVLIVLCRQQVRAVIAPVCCHACAVQSASTHVFPLPCDGFTALVCMRVCVCVCARVYVCMCVRVCVVDFQNLVRYAQVRWLGQLHYSVDGVWSSRYFGGGCVCVGCERWVHHPCRSWPVRDKRTLVEVQVMYTSFRQCMHTYTCSGCLQQNACIHTNLHSYTCIYMPA